MAAFLTVAVYVCMLPIGWGAALPPLDARVWLADEATVWSPTQPARHTFLHSVWRLRARRSLAGTLDALQRCVAPPSPRCGPPSAATVRELAQGLGRAAQHLSPLPSAAWHHIVGVLRRWLPVAAMLLFPAQWLHMLHCEVGGGELLARQLLQVVGGALCGQRHGGLEHRGDAVQALVQLLSLQDLGLQMPAVEPAAVWVSACFARAASSSWMLLCCQESVAFSHAGGVRCGSSCWLACVIAATCSCRWQFAGSLFLPVSLISLLHPCSCSCRLLHSLFTKHVPPSMQQTLCALSRHILDAFGGWHTA